MSTVTTANVDKTDRAGVLAVARSCADYIQNRSPHLRMIAVSGSLTREHQGVHDDADFFIVSKRGRVWETFMACFWNGWRFSRRLGLPRTFFCFNYLVDEAHPEEIDLSRAEYVREFLNLEVLAGLGVYSQLLDRFRTRLSAVEPHLYEAVRLRVREALAVADTSQDTRTAPRHLLLLYRVLRSPFIALAKSMEGRRRRRFPGGLVYSNGRVIRSHFRRSWGNAPVDPEGVPSSEAFTRVAAEYDELVATSPANRHMRAIVHETLQGLVRQGDRTIDLGAGTGVDAIWLARQGASVLAIDVAEGMVQEANRRVRSANLEDRIEVRRLAIQELRTLLPEQARRYDLAIADFGALNLSGDPERWAPAIGRLLKPGGYLVATVMNRWCAWELIAGMLRGRPSFALRRLRADPIGIGGVPLAVDLYTPAGFARRLSTHFRVVSVRGLCVSSPPPALEHLGTALPAVGRGLAWLDRRLGRWRLFRGLGDHFLVVLQQRPQRLLSYRTRSAITASPVVADVNGDGSPEIMVAADRIYLTDPRGRNIRGWPVRLGGPMASTPAIYKTEDSATIYVGSDDDSLHVLSFEGKPPDGFPFRTGGDVFSSPWVGDLDGDGLPEIAFGSDDGGIYLLDQEGQPLKGWPVKTGGYVSASPTVVDTRSGKAIIIGSWDRRLYVLDEAGQALNGWPRTLDFPIWSSAAAADVDGDGWAEIVVATSQLFVFRGDGRPLPGFPARLGGYAVASPAIGDIDGDGRPEIVVCSDRVYAFRTDGRPVPGFPVNVGAYLWASPILLDVDGDGRPEIVVGDFQGKLWAVTGEAGIAPGYPRRLGKRITAAAAAADLTGDGYLDLVVASTDGGVVALPTESRDHPKTAPWPTFPAGRMSASVIDTSARLASRAAAAFTGSEAGTLQPRNNGVGQPAQRAPSDMVEVRLGSKFPRPFQPTEVHLTLPNGTGLRGGLLHYTLGDRDHPSPLLGGDGRYFALVEPLSPLRRVEFTCELLWEDERTTRLPDTGSFQFRVGVPGLRRKGPADREGGL